MAIQEHTLEIETPEGFMAAPTARPSTGGPHPAVIVIMEAFGVNANIVGVVNRLAEQGFVATAPDLFHRSGRLRFAPYDKLQEMRTELRVGFDDHSIDADVQATIDHLQADPGVNGAIGIVGFCLGGRVSLQSAIRANGLSAAAVFYGGGMFPDADQPEAFSALTECERLAIPIVGFFGSEDQNPTPDQAKALDEQLAKLGAEHRFHYYEGAGHGFFCDDRESYREAAAEDAWQKTLAFFGEKLR